LTHFLIKPIVKTFFVCLFLFPHKIQWKIFTNKTIIATPFFFFFSFPILCLCFTNRLSAVHEEGIDRIDNRGEFCGNRIIIFPCEEVLVDSNNFVDGSDDLLAESNLINRVTGLGHNFNKFHNSFIARILKRG